MTEGGDKRTPRAKVDIAKREQQIVALKLRGVAVNDIARVIGLSRRAVSAAFNKALRRNTDQDLQAHHLSETAKLDMEEANIWRVMDANKDDPKGGVRGVPRSFAACTFAGQAAGARRAYQVRHHGLLSPR
jgi:DNA-binding CsgD family transcriptional regulator